MLKGDDGGRPPGGAAEVRRLAREWIQAHLDPGMRLADWLELLADSGWAVALTTLAHERTGLGTQLGAAFAAPAPAGSRQRARREVTVAEFLAGLRRDRAGRGSASGSAMISAGALLLIRLAAELGRDADPLVRQELVRLHTICQLNTWNGRRGRAAVQAGGRPGPEASIGKLMASQIARLWRDAAAEIAGPAAMLAGPDGPLRGQLALQALAAPGPAIYGGSDQIQRNVIGERVLGLPKEPDVSRNVPFRDIATGTRRLGEGPGS
jgi:alkylation response protein AidB-like acyl-CoA dehydrogenase